MSAIATVISITGQAFAKNAAGETRILKIGDTILEGEVVFTTEGSNIELALSDGNTFSIADSAEVAITEDLLTTTANADEYALESEDISALINALESNSDLNEEIDAPAAGGGPASDGHNFIRLARIVENLPEQLIESNVAPLTQIDNLIPNIADSTAIAPTPELSLSASSAVEEGGLINFTATLTSPAITTMSITLSNGAVITIVAGSSSGSVQVVASNDVYAGSNTITTTINSTDGGGFTSLNISDTPSTTIITDNGDPTQLFLSASNSVVEGQLITYTATLENPAQSDVQVLLDNGLQITIAAGESTGSATVTSIDDVYNGDSLASAAIVSATGGNFENLIFDNNPAITTVVDDNDSSFLSLSASTNVADGEDIVYTATLSNPADSDLVITLENGQIITIVAGTSSASAISTANGIGTVSNAIATTSGGNFENLSVDNSTVSTNVFDPTQIANLSLSATPSVQESGIITYTATIDQPASSPMTISLSNGQQIIIATGSTSGSVTTTASDDIYLGGNSTSANIISSSGGDFISVTIDNTPATTTITDDADVTNLSLSATPSVTEGGTIIYTATLDNPADTAMTVTLSNGQVIAIAAGASTGSVNNVASDDVYGGGDSASATITDTTGGNFENLVVNTTAATTTITDNADVTNLSLSATPSVTEGGTITYTATLDNPTDTAMTVTLSNGQVIAIAAGASTGSVDVTASNDVYGGGDSASATITGTTGGNFENLVVDTSAANTTITDDADVTNLSLSATPSVTEGGTITYTATLDNPTDTAMTVTLSNGQVIAIAAGASTGSVNIVASDDIYGGGDSTSATITSTSGGNFENLVVDTSAANTTITDDADVTNLTLSATGTVVEGGTITYTATLDNPTDTAMTVTLSNGQVIAIAAGASTGTVDVTASDDVYGGGDSASATITGTTGGNFENLVVDTSAATTTITDNADVTNLTLSATGSVVEGGTITYTATLNNPADTAMTVTLSNGQVIAIAAGASFGSMDVTASDDVYGGGDSMSATITGTTGGNFENLQVDNTAATTTITDDSDTTNLSLSATPSVTEGGTITYSATLDNPTDTAMTVTLSNGQVITIAAGASTGTVDFTASDDVYGGGDSASATITGTNGGNFENLVVDTTAATTTITDDADVTNLTLSATGTVVEGGTITYTATLDNPADTAMTVTLSNGQVITIAAGDSTGSVAVTASDDVYGGGDSASATITGTNGGNFENLVVDTTAATTTITDDADVTNLTLSATGTVVEGGTITYTATLDNPADTAMTVTLSNGQVITIAAGANSGTVDAIASGSNSASVQISSSTGGNFENLQTDTTPAVTSITDLPPSINVTAIDVTEESISVGDAIATFTSSDPGGDALTHQILNNSNGYFVLVGNEVRLTQQGVDAINNDALNLNSLDISVQVTADGQTATSIDTSNITRIDEAPVTSTENYAAVEGATLSVSAAAGVLINDTDPEGAALTVTQFATDTAGNNQTTANGSNTITTALGGTITLQADGSFTYVAPASLIHPVSDVLQDSFAYRSNDGSNQSAWTEVTIDVSDTAPIAANDNDSVAFGENISGNVISGQGGDGSGTDTLGEDSAELSAVIFNGVSYSGFDASGNLSINGDYGTLTINRDGSYDYASNQSLTSVNVGGGNLSSWSGVNLYGFNAGTNFENGSLLNLNAANSTANIDYRNGFGLSLNSPGNSDSSNQLDQRNGNAEAIAIDLTTSTVSAVVSLAGVGSNDGGEWSAYDSSFNLVASDSFGGNTNSVTINPGQTFQYIVFTALDDNDDYNIAGVSYTPDVNLQESFSYILEDSDGDQAPAILTIEHDPLPVAVSDTATTYESALSTGSQSGNHSTVSSGNLIDNDKGINSSTSIIEIEFNNSTYTADAQGVITVDSPQGLLVVYTQDDLVNNIRAGDYQYTLETNSLQGDNASETFTYTLSDGQTISSSDLTVNIVDDAPIGGDIEQTINPAPSTQTYNLVIVLDSSGSMGNTVNNNSSVTRMDVAKDALNQLFDSYDALGNVNIQIVDFNSSVTESGWYNDNLNSATDYLSTIIPGGGTRYNTALDAVMTDFAPPTADKTLLYFISDGDPNSGYDVNSTQQSNWESFLNSNNVDISFGIGIGNVTIDSLEPIAYPNQDTNSDGTDDYAIQVSNANDLADTLLSTLDNGVVSGSVSVLTTGGVEGLFVGADGGFIDNIVVDGVTYNYIPGVNDQIQVITALNGTLNVNFVSGEYSYQVDLDKTTKGEQEVIEVTVTDNDGDSLTANVIINLEYEPNLDANRDIILTNIPNGSAITIPAMALMHNDTADGNTTINNTGNTSNGNVTGTDPITFTSTLAPTLSASDFSATATKINEVAGDGENTPINNSIATAVDFSDRSLFGSDGSALSGLSVSGGFNAAYYGSLSNDGNTANGSDQDWLQLSLAQGENIWFDIDNAGLAVEMSIYDSNGNFIQTIADNGQPWGGFTAPSEDTYYAVIETTDTGTGNYELYMTINTSNAVYNDTSSFEYTLENNGATDTTTVDIQSAISGNSIIGDDDDEIIIGDNNNDTLLGNAGKDALIGGQGSDTLDGGDDNDLLLGGQGDDILSGGLGSDIFAWELADKGTVNSPELDTVNDFNVNENDLLDLRDLLIDESNSDLTEFLYFETSGSDTIIHISSEGGFDSGVYNSAQEDQTIQLSGVDLMSGFGGDQAAIIQDLINKNNLLTD